MESSSDANLTIYERLFISFKERLEKWGVTLDESERVWRGTLAYYNATCADGHKCTPQPSYIKAGRKPSRMCSIDRRTSGQRDSHVGANDIRPTDQNTWPCGCLYFGFQS